VLEAALWGFVGGLALLIGALAGLRLRVSRHVTGLIMAFGAGVLISALAFELTEEAFDLAGADAVAAGLAAGGLAFFAGDWLIDRRGGDQRKHMGGEQAGGSAMAIVLGAVLDGIPESIAIGITLLEGNGVGVPVVAAVFMSNLPESLAAAQGLQKAGHSDRWILGMWALVALAGAVAAALGYGLLGDASPDVVGFIQAFAAGAILVMLADTMMPEAFKYGGKTVGLVTLLGFAAAFLLSTV